MLSYAMKNTKTHFFIPFYVIGLLSISSKYNKEKRVNFVALGDSTKTQSDAYSSRFVAVRVTGIFDGKYMLSILSAYHKVSGTTTRAFP